LAHESTVLLAGAVVGAAPCRQLPQIFEVEDVERDVDAGGWSGIDLSLRLVVIDANDGRPSRLGRVEPVEVSSDVPGLADLSSKEARSEGCSIGEATDVDSFVIVCLRPFSGDG
jgi:hypothetical protein